MSRMPVRPPQKEYGHFYVKGDGICYEMPKAGEIVVMTGYVWVVEAVRDEKTGQISYLTQVEPVVGEGTTIRLQAKDMTNGKLKTILGDLGIIIHSPRDLEEYLALTCSDGDYTNKKPRILIGKPGWFAEDRGFHTGSHTALSTELAAKAYRFEPVPRSPFAVRGTLESWYDNIGRHIENNSLALAMALLFIASLFLKQLGLGSRIFCFWGAKGTGKTLGTQCAATIFGNGVDPAAGLFASDPPYLTKFSTTLNGIEPLLARYAPMPIAMDEMTEQDCGVMADLTYKVSSGEGKHRMTSQMKPAESNRWLLTVVTTAEMPLSEALTASGKRVHGGMLDRAIDIAIGHDGMFPESGDFDSFRALTRHLKRATGNHYGSAGLALLEYAVNNKDAIRERLAEADDIEEALTPESCGDGETRVVKCFAAAVVAGRIAIDAGVLRCDEERVMDAMQHVTDIWWFSRGGVLRTIAEFLADADEADRLVSHEPSIDKRARAFITEDNVVIPDAEFDKAFGDKAKQMVSELASLNALVREQTNRNKSRFCNNRLFAYVIPLDRLLPYMEQVEQERPETDKKSPREKVEELFE